jgi:hypothetical protein
MDCEDSHLASTRRKGDQHTWNESKENKGREDKFDEHFVFT